jgi:uncharacterized damage-inducible protein DinB
MLQQFALLAEYNAWMNEKIYATAAELAEEVRTENRGAFFGSIHGTLNHLLVADRIWLQRFARYFTQFSVLEWVGALPQPTALDEILFADFQAMREHRRALDATIKEWIGALSQADLDQVLQYSSIKGIPASRSFSGVLLHFFNHQTHHRGQVTTLLSQLGKDVGATDLLLLVADRKN